MPRRASGPRAWLRPAETNAKTGRIERHAQWYVKDDGGKRVPSGRFAYPVAGIKGDARSEVERRNAEEKAAFDVFLADYIRSKYAPSVQKGRAALDIQVTDVLLLASLKSVPLISHRRTSTPASSTATVSRRTA